MILCEGMLRGEKISKKLFSHRFSANIIQKEKHNWRNYGYLIYHYGNSEIIAKEIVSPKA